MSKELIITSGNSRFFEDLKKFINSLRTVGEYTGRVVICDNQISGTWDQPGTYLDESGFQGEQIRYMEDRDVEIVNFSDLVNRNGISRQHVESIVGKTQRYPYKIIYNCLISKEYENKVSKICYLDSDVLFQSPVSRIFNSIKSDSIYMTSEHDKIGNMRFMKEWIKTTDVSFGSQNDEFLDKMYSSDNMCTGFIAGTSGTFNRFMQLCWIFASSRLVEFHTDQPLVNIVHSYYGYPVVELDKSIVLHLKGTPRSKIEISNSNILYENKVVTAVHFNGGSDMFKNGSINLEYDPSRSKRSRLRSVLSKVKSALVRT